MHTLTFPVVSTQPYVIDHHIVPLLATPIPTTHSLLTPPLHSNPPLTYPPRPEYEHDT